MIKRKSKELKPYLVAITGNFGAGKSAVGDLLKEHGYLLIDTDEIVREILKNKNLVTEKIISVFGLEVKNTNSEYFIDKKRLALIVFNDELKRKELESIVHPAVEQTLQTFFSLNKDKEVVFVLVPLLFECGLEKNYHEVWCVKCDNETRFARLEARGFSRDESAKRLSMQMPETVKESLSDFTLDNSGQLENTKSQLEKRLKNGFD